jgi:hypothetical protein
MTRHPSVVRLAWYLLEGLVWQGLGSTNSLQSAADGQHVRDWLDFRTQTAVGIAELERHLARARPHRSE